MLTFLRCETLALVIDLTFRTLMPILIPSRFSRPCNYNSTLIYSFTKALQFLLDIEFLRSEGVGWCQFSEVNFPSWKSCADAVWTHISQAMSISSSVGFVSPLEPFVSPPHVLGKSRNPKGLVWCSLHQGAVSHFRLDYGWQVKENKNCLYRRDTEENSSFLLHISKLGPVKTEAKNWLRKRHRQFSFQWKWIDFCIPAKKGCNK